jgi:hypothetical protein
VDQGGELADQVRDDGNEKRGQDGQQHHQDESDGQPPRQPAGGEPTHGRVEAHRQEHGHQD